MTELTGATEASQSLGAAETASNGIQSTTQSGVNIVESTNTESAPMQETEKAATVRELIREKVNHVEREVDPYSDEGRSYIRKGIDYDRIREGYDKYQPVVSSLEKIAKEAGFNDVNQYIANVDEQLRQIKLRELSEMEPDALAVEALKSRQLEAELNQLRASRSELERQEKEAEKFHQLFPDVKESDVPAEIWDKFADGESLIEGYRQHKLSLQEQRIAELEKKLLIQDQNKANESSAVDSFTGKGAEQERIYTAEELRNMSPQEIKANLAAVNRSYKKIKEGGI